MTEVASLSFSIDSSDARTAARDLRDLRSSSSDVTNQARELSQVLSTGGDNFRDLSRQSKDLNETLRGSIGILQSMVRELDGLRRGLSEVVDQTKKIDEATRRLEAFGRIFNTTAAGIEIFTRSSSQIGMSANETVTALSRIQSAMEGITSEGRAARAIFEAYGVNVNQTGPNAAANIQRQFLERWRSVPMTGQSNRDLMFALGPLGPDSLQTVLNPSLLTEEQRRVRLEARERESRIAQIGEATTNLRRDNTERNARLNELRTNYSGSDIFEIIRRQFETDNQERARLEGYDAAWKADPSTAPRTNITDRANATLAARFGRWREYATGGEMAQNQEYIREQFNRDRQSGYFNALGTYYSNMWSNFLQEWNMPQRQGPAYQEGQASQERLNMFRRMGDESSPGTLVMARMMGLDYPSSSVFDPEATARNFETDTSLRRSQQVIAMLRSQFGVRQEDLDVIAGMPINEILNGQAGVDARIPREYLNAIRERFDTEDKIQIVGRTRQIRDQRSARGIQEGEAGFGVSPEMGDWQAQLERIRQAYRDIGDENKRNQMIQTEINELLAQNENSVKRQRSQSDLALGIESDALNAATAFDGDVSPGVRNGAALRARMDRQFAAARPGSQMPVGEQLLRALRQRNLEWQNNFDVRDQLRENDIVNDSLRRGDEGNIAETRRRLQVERELKTEIAQAQASGEREALEIVQNRIRVRMEELRLVEEVAVRSRADANLDRRMGAQQTITDTYRGRSLGDVNRLNAEIDMARSLLPDIVSAAGGDESVVRANLIKALRESTDLQRRVNEALQAQSESTAALTEANHAAAMDIARAGGTGDSVLNRRAMRSAQRRRIEAIADPAERQRQLELFEQGNATSDSDQFNGLLRNFQRQNRNSQMEIDYLEGRRVPIQGGAMAPGGAAGATFREVSLPNQNVQGLIDQQAQALGVDINQARILAMIESGGNQVRRNRETGQIETVTSSAGARGVYQLMPGTAAGLRVNPDDINENIRGGLTYWSQMLQKAGGDPMGAWIAYNTGPNSRFFRNWQATGDTTNVPRETTRGLNMFRSNLSGNFSLPDVPAAQATAIPGTPGTGGAPEAAELDPRRALYGGARMRAMAAANSARDGGVDTDGREGVIIDAALIADANQALAQYTRRLVEGQVALDDMNKVITAARESSYAATMERSRQSTERDVIGLEDRAMEVERLNPQLAQRLRQRAGQVRGQGDARARQELRGRFEAEGRQTTESMADAEFQFDNWWMSPWGRAGQTALNRQRRRLSDTYGDDGSVISPEEREKALSQTQRLNEMQELNQITRATQEAFMGLGQAAGTALETIIMRGGDAREVINALVSSMAGQVLRQATGMMVTKGIDMIGNLITGGGSKGGGGLLGLLGLGGGSSFGGTFSTSLGDKASLISGINPIPSANGNIFWGGDLIPFADGGVVMAPTTFPMTGGRTGLMGEAGPEAIIPLKRGADGKLGVASGGQAPVYVNFNYTGSPQDFGASSQQIAGALAAAVRRGQRR